MAMRDIMLIQQAINDMSEARNSLYMAGQFLVVEYLDTAIDEAEDNKELLLEIERKNQ